MNSYIYSSRTMQTSTSYERRKKWRFSLKWRNGCDFKQPCESTVFKMVPTTSLTQNMTSLPPSISIVTSSRFTSKDSLKSSSSTPPSSHLLNSSISTPSANNKSKPSFSVTSSSSLKLSWATVVSKNLPKSGPLTDTPTTPTTEPTLPTSPEPFHSIPLLHTPTMISFQMEDTVLPEVLHTPFTLFPAASIPHFSSSSILVPVLAPAAVPASDSAIYSNSTSTSTSIETTLTETIQEPVIETKRPTKISNQEISPKPLPSSPASAPPSPPLTWNLAAQYPKHKIASPSTPNSSISPPPLRLHSTGSSASQQNSTATPSVSSHKKKGSISTLTNTKTLSKFLETYQLDFQPKPLVLRGLVNQGNLCFLNVILQPLIHCIPFFNLIQDIHHQVQLDSTSTPLLAGFVQLFAEFDSQHIYDTRIPVNPEPIYIYLENKMSQYFVRGRQEDAEEFLSYLLDGLHNEFLIALPTLSPNSMHEENDPFNVNKGEIRNGKQGGSVDDDENGEWHVVKNHRKVSTTRFIKIQCTPITSLFGGSMKSRFKMPGSKASIVIEPFQSLPLDIQPDTVHTLMDALLYTVHSEHNVGVNGTKQNIFNALPTVFIFQLKRFYFDVQLQLPMKLCKQIEIPLEFQLDPIRFLGQPTQPVPAYRLFGVVYHHGATALGGHYTCDVLPTKERLVRIDDTELITLPIPESSTVLVPPQPSSHYLHSSSGSTKFSTSEPYFPKKLDLVDKNTKKESDCVPYLLFYEHTQYVRRPESFLDFKHIPSSHSSKSKRKKKSS
ncbi:Ubiquitin carboxyl-terminal hydrolase 10 [Coelomomyces lativittatus]|nr:Ubiquitin carboxyl-terminal hydrolase 10 [Coelomomyces lativittatus]KAJ1515973.1 Ubiquitin carboxyl-terminal hydrolase 10 [Coelomomyces lativittatus]KAJ1517361.1 Ubiquitin carboxyl-terminal hydrolase 10 [Coelomomyces lativittatus]